jgi:hypothetical protein
MSWVSGHQAHWLHQQSRRSWLWSGVQPTDLSIGPPTFGAQWVGAPQQPIPTPPASVLRGTPPPDVVQIIPSTSWVIVPPQPLTPEFIRPRSLLRGPPPRDVVLLLPTTTAVIVPPQVSGADATPRLSIVRGPPPPDVKMTMPTTGTLIVPQQIPLSELTRQAIFRWPVLPDLTPTVSIRTPLVSIPPRPPEQRPAWLLRGVPPADVKMLMPTSAQLIVGPQTPIIRGIGCTSGPIIPALVMVAGPTTWPLIVPQQPWVQNQPSWLRWPIPPEAVTPPPDLLALILALEARVARLESLALSVLPTRPPWAPGNEP